MLWTAQTRTQPVRGHAEVSRALAAALERTRALTARARHVCDRAATARRDATENCGQSRARRSRRATDRANAAWCQSVIAAPSSGRIVRRRSKRSQPPRRLAAATEAHGVALPELVDVARPESNRLLRFLPARDYARLQPHLRTVHVPARQVLIEPGEPIHHVHFPRSCVVATMTPIGANRLVQTSAAGAEGMAGIPLLLGASSMNAAVVVQIGGEAVRCDAAAFRCWLDDASEGRSVLLRYTQVVLEQTEQAVACERLHTPEQRTASWLLLTADRVGDEELTLTHEFLGQVLGVRRATVTNALGTLERAGLVLGSRRHVRIVDRGGLMAASCECYRAMRDSYDRFIATA